MNIDNATTPSAPDATASIPAVVLAGGLGTRLRSVVADRPKVLADVGGRPFLTYLLDFLARHGFRRAVICTGYMAGAVRAALGETYRGVALDYSEETVPLGTGGALRLALPLVDSPRVFVMNGDSYCDADARAFVRSCAAETDSPAGDLVVVRQNDTGRFGRVLFDDRGRVTAFEEKGRSAGPGWINAGLYLLSRPLLESIPAGRAVSLEREVFPAWAGRGLVAWPTDGAFIDIGDPASYAAAEAFFKAKEEHG